MPWFFFSFSDPGAILMLFPSSFIRKNSGMVKRNLSNNRPFCYSPWNPMGLRSLCQELGANTKNTFELYYTATENYKKMLKSSSIGCVIISKVAGYVCVFRTFSVMTMSVLQNHSSLSLLPSLLISKSVLVLMLSIAFWPDEFFLYYTLINWENLSPHITCRI